jgi:hypothetical protein
VTPDLSHDDLNFDDDDDEYELREGPMDYSAILDLAVRSETRKCNE